MEVSFLSYFSKITLPKRYTPQLHKIFIILSWLLGLCLGYYFGVKTPLSVISLMRMSVSQRVSIVWLFFVLLIPLFLSFLALRFSLPQLFIPLAFFKAYSLSYCIFCVTYFFGSAGWLVRLLCFFSDSCCVVILILFWLSHTVWRKRKCLYNLGLCAAATILIGCIDYFIVSPFGTILFNY